MSTDHGGSALTESLIKSIKPVPVLVAGDVMVDEYILGKVDRISPESPVPVLAVTDKFRRLGGAGNVVRNLVSMGANVALFAAVGKDGAGRWFRTQCEQMAVDCFWIKDHASRPTTIKTRVVARNQQIVRIDEEQIQDVDSQLEKGVIDEIHSVMPQVKAVVLSDYGKGFLTQTLLEATIAAAKKNRVPVLVDPKGLDYTRYHGAFCITPNLREASQASGIEIYDRESLIRAGHVLLEQTAAHAMIVTRGKEGSTLISRSEARDFPVKPVEIIDVTGAGDTVIATLALCIANGFALENAITIANLAASLVVSRFGASAVTLQELLDAVNNQNPDTKVVPCAEVGPLMRAHRIRGERIVFTNGCFDIFHAGHVRTLREASKLGEVLVVGINSDASVSRLKGPGRPVICEAERVEIVSALGFVDYVVVFGEDTPLSLIEEVRPDVLVKGEDWDGKEVVGEDIVKARGGEVRFVRHIKGLSTTELIRKIRGEV